MFEKNNDNKAEISETEPKKVESVEKKSKKIEPKKIGIFSGIAVVIAVVVVLTLSLIINNSNSLNYTTIFDTSIEGEIGDEWSVKSSNTNVADAELKTDMGFPGRSLVLTFHHVGSVTITLTNSETDEVIEYNLAIDADNKISIEK